MPCLNFSRTKRQHLESLFTLLSRDNPPLTMRSPFPPPICTLLTLLTFLFNLPFSPSVQAQSFRPIPDSGRCSGFTEGQGLYIVGGHGTIMNFATQTFMLDLSVSWNTSDPVFKKIQGGPMTTEIACTMTNNGEDLFVLSRGTGYIYNVKSDSWDVLQNNMLPYTPDMQPPMLAADSATGFIYIYGYTVDFSGKEVLLSVDVRTKTVNTSETAARDFPTTVVAAWSDHLKCMLIFPSSLTPYALTPSEIDKPTKGWAELQVPPQQDLEEGLHWGCVAPAYGGTKMVFLGSSYIMKDDSIDITKNDAIYIFDVVKRTWKKGAPATGYLGNGACAVTGDQFIVWGGGDDDKQTNETRVFNLKTEEWVASYSAPPSSQRPQTPTPQPDLGDTSSNDKQLVTIIIIVTGVLLAIILAAISVYLWTSRRMAIVTQGSGTARFGGTFGRRDPSAISPDPHARHRWYSLLSWLYRGPNGARPPSEHPHAVVELEMRNLQEGAVEVQSPAQHPHATVDQGSASSQNYKAELESIRSHDGN
ncbi:MAG: hypothetical protein J3Q66DRAFT_432903 [Benniella sp.]|nr:MAG: hypothetical protein J3Q66DRAFT_432903 [Benniella sp.]